MRDRQQDRVPFICQVSPSGGQWVPCPHVGEGFEAADWHLGSVDGGGMGRGWRKWGSFALSVN